MIVVTLNAVIFDDIVREYEDVVLGRPRSR